MRFQVVRAVVVLGLSGALVGVLPSSASAVSARSRCRATVFVTNTGSDTVSTSDVKSRNKQPADIAVGSLPAGVAITPDGNTAIVANGGGTVSTIDVPTRTKDPSGNHARLGPNVVAVTPHWTTPYERSK